MHLSLGAPVPLALTSAWMTPLWKVGAGMASATVALALLFHSFAS